MIEPYFLLMRWIQTIPVALLMFAPFQEKELRWGWRKSCLISVGYMLLGCVALAAISARPARAINGTSLCGTSAWR